MEKEFRYKLHSVARQELATIESEHEASWVLDYISNLKLSTQAEQQNKLDEVIQRRKAQEPLAYIFGSWNFRGHEIQLNSATLIPRPETEELVEAVIMSFENSHLSSEKMLKSGFRLADLGAGSGCIGLTTVADFLEDVQTETNNAQNISSNFELFLVEKSAEACEVIKKNVEHFKKKIMNTKVTVLNMDWSDFNEKNLDVIVSNPPYITPEEYEQLDIGVRKYEPRLALYCEESLSCYKQVIEVAKFALNPRGWLFMELGISQGESVQDYISGNPMFNEIRTLKDIAKKPRFFCARKSGEING